MAVVTDSATQAHDISSASFSHAETASVNYTNAFSYTPEDVGMTQTSICLFKRSTWPPSKKAM
jgi:hypothetical protein